MFQSKLKGHRVAVLAADGFEQVELTIPLKELEREGAEVDVLSLHRGTIRGNNLHLPGKKIKVDGLIAKADPESYDALFIPGGFVNPDFLRGNEAALRFVTAMVQANKPVATLCHGPWVLASAGLLEGRQLTSWPNIKDDLKNVGAAWRNEAVVRDGNLLTSRGPHDLPDFKKAMIDLFAATPPQAGAPPRRGGMGWLITSALLGIAAYAVNRLLEHRLAEST